MFKRWLLHLLRDPELTEALALFLDEVRYQQYHQRKGRGVYFPFPPYDGAVIESNHGGPFQMKDLYKHRADQTHALMTNTLEESETP